MQFLFVLLIFVFGRAPAHYRPRYSTKKRIPVHRIKAKPRYHSRVQKHNFQRQSRRPVYFHDIYQQYSPHYPNYIAPVSYGGRQSDINKLLEIHKRIRGRSIQWNPSIARLAQMHASSCPSGHANLPRGASGQNMAWTSTMEDGANMWASEGILH